MKELGNRVQALREKQGLTVRQLARYADLDDKTVSNIEAGVGNPTIGTLEKVSKALGCEINELVK